MAREEREVLLFRPEGCPTGKTTALLLDAFRFTAYPGYTAAVFHREAWPLQTVIDRAIQTHRWGEPVGRDRRRAQFNFPNGARIAFIAVERNRHIENLTAAAFHRLYFIELWQFSAKQYAFLSTRCRCPLKDEIPLAIRAESNQGNDWISGRFIKEVGEGIYAA